MGSSVSKLDKEEAVQLCKDRKKFIKQAIEQRTHFANYHIAYINSLKRVSNALRDYVEGDKPRDVLLEDHFSTRVKKPDSGFISISPKLSQINYMRPHGNPSVIIEEVPPQNIRVEAYSPHHHFGSDGSPAMQWSPMNSSSYRPSYPPPSPQYPKWDFFWNPFSSLDNYGDQNRNSIDQGVFDDDITGLRKVREREGIPELEEETDQEEFDENVNVLKERVFNNSNKKYTSGNHDRHKVIIEDGNDDEDEDECGNIDSKDCDSENGHDRDLLKPHKRHSVEISKAQSVGQVRNLESMRENLEYSSKKEIPGYMAYINRRPTSMVDVIKDLEAQFTVICSAGNVLSVMLEASKAQCSSSSNDLSGACLVAALKQISQIFRH